MKVYICANCNEPIKRGESWMGLIGLRIHLKCSPLAEFDKEPALPSEKPEDGTLRQDRRK